jgi:hypothetical protein
VFARARINNISRLASRWTNLLVKIYVKPKTARKQIVIIPALDADTRSIMNPAAMQVKKLSSKSPRMTLETANNKHKFPIVPKPRFETNPACKVSSKNKNRKISMYLISVRQRQI